MSTTVLVAGDVAVDLRNRTARVADEPVDLSDREFDLITALLRHRGQVLSREQLLAEVWGYGFDPGSNVVDVYIGYLRRKVGTDLIRTVRGAGYRVD